VLERKNTGVKKSRIRRIAQNVRGADNEVPVRDSKVEMERGDGIPTWEVNDDGTFWR
jgi:hypothetical protein